MNKFDEIGYVLSGINPESKIAVFLYDLKIRIKYLIPYQVREFYRKHIETIWSPQHSRLRKVIPRYWHDLDYILTRVNFEIIKSFYEDEFIDGPVDWEADEKHKEFANWLFSAYHYITVTRPDLENEMDAAYPDNVNIDSNLFNKSTYKSLYGEVDRIEKYIHKMDTKILIELIRRRDFLWT